MSLRSLAILLLGLSFAACASAPPAAPPTAPKAETPRMIDLLCAEGARYVTFDKLGLPTGEQPQDVALTRDSVWVLFPDRLLQLGRSGEHVEVKIHLAPSGIEWSKLDLDPLDESVWVASTSRPMLFVVNPDGQMKTVKLQKVEGAGGLWGLLVARDALYAQPTSAEMGVWRIDRSGKVLGTAFPVPKQAKDEPETLPEAYASIRLDRNADGSLLAWNSWDRTTWQVDDQGVWRPSDSRLFEHLPTRDAPGAVKGMNVGEASEHWFLTNGAWAPGKLFFWKGKPVFLGSYANREKTVGTDTVLYLPGDSSLKEALMTCHKRYIRSVATDATGYAGVGYDFLVLGDLATAPDLP